MLTRWMSLNEVIRVRFQAGQGGVDGAFCHVGQAGLGMRTTSW
jgi:hypothetical protein